MSLSVKSLTKADLDSVVTIANSFSHNSWSYSVFDDCLKAGYESFVLLDSKTDAVVGFLVALIQDTECHIMNIGVVQTHQRDGGASQLLDCLKKYLDKTTVSRILLEVRASNEAAILFYKKRGFKALGVRKGYYPLTKGRREDALIFYHTRGDNTN